MKRTVLLAILLILTIYPIEGRSEIDHISSTLISGDINGLAFSGNYIYGTGEYSLKIFDFSNPDTLQPIYMQRLTYETDRIFVHNGYVYVGPELYSLSNDGIPRFVRNLELNPADMSFVGDTAYVGTMGDGFHIYDIADPQNPVDLGNYLGGNLVWIDFVEIVGQYAYLPGGGLLILDISDPAEISYAGHYAMEEVPVKLSIEENKAFVSWYLYTYPSGHTYGIDILDISTPTSPQLIERLSLDRMPCNFYQYNNYLYVLSDGIRTYRIYDWGLDEVGQFGIFSNDYFITGNEDHIFVGNSYQQDLAAINASDPESLYVEASYSGPGSVQKVEVVDGYAYTACWPSGLKIVDVSNPLSPNLVGGCQIPILPNVELFISPPHAFSTGGSIINIADPDSPYVAVTDSILIGNDIFVKDNYAYVGGIFGLKIINIVDPLNPALVTLLPNLEIVSDIFVSGNYAYVTCDRYPNYNIKIFNIGDRSSLVLVAQLDSSRTAIVVGQYAYCTGVNSSLSIYNIVDPANPQFVGSYGNGGVEDLAIGGNYAYFSTSDNFGVTMIDISDPSNPTNFDDYPLRYINDLFVADGYIFVATTRSLEILRRIPTGIEEDKNVLPSSFSLSQSYPNPFNPSTTIEYDLIKDTDVTLNIYDILGRNVATLVNQKQPAGRHNAIWNAGAYSSGIYFYRIQAGDYTETKKMVLMK